MNDTLLHRLFGFICGSAGLVMAITGAMFWFDPPDQALPAWGLLALMIGGSAATLTGIGVARRLAPARYVMAGLAGIGLLAAVGGLVREALAGNLGGGIIILTAVMPLVLVIAVMIELGRQGTRASS